MQAIGLWFLVELFSDKKCITIQMSMFNNVNIVAQFIWNLEADFPLL